VFLWLVRDVGIGRCGFVAALEPVGEDGRTVAVIIVAAIRLTLFLVAFVVSAAACLRLCGMVLPPAGSSLAVEDAPAFLIR
jgi:hypothetical protein